jgi:DNA gyrase/topoisomerase IV subunit A
MWASKNLADENVVITISHAGYIKRTNLSNTKLKIEGGGAKVLELEIKIS